MKQARHLMVLERKAGATPTLSQDRRVAQDKTVPTRQLSQPLLVTSLCNRLARAIAMHDPVGAGQVRGTLARLSLKNHSRLSLAQRANYRTIILGVDA